MAGFELRIVDASHRAGARHFFKSFANVRRMLPLIGSGLFTYLFQRISALRLSAEIMAHLDASVRIARDVKAAVFNPEARNALRGQLSFLAQRNDRIDKVIARIKEAKQILYSVNPQFDELTAFLHDIGKLEASDGAVSPFWGHSLRGFEVLSRHIEDYNIQSLDPSISAKDIREIMRYIARFHIAISNYCTGERSFRTFSQVIDNPGLKVLLQRPEFARVFWAALLDITISDVGAYKYLSLFKIEQYLNVYDTLRKSTGSSAETDTSIWRLNQIFGVGDREIDRRTLEDPLYYFRSFESGARRVLSEDAFDRLLVALTHVDKLVYFRRFLAGLNIDACALFMQKVVSVVDGQPIGGDFSMVELPQMSDQARFDAAIKLMNDPQRQAQLFNPKLRHLQCDDYVDDFGTVNKRTKIDLLGYERRSRTVGFPASMTHAVLWRAAFESAGMEVLDTPSTPWRDLEKRGAEAISNSDTACIPLKTSVGSFLALQERGAGTIVRVIENDGVHPICYPDRGFAHVAAIPALFPEVYTPTLRTGGYSGFKRSQLYGTLARLGLDNKRKKVFFETLQATEIPKLPAPFSPKALGREGGRKILLIGREKNLHPQRHDVDNLLDWMVAEYPDISIVTPGMFRLGELGAKSLDLASPYEWKVEVIGPIVERLVEEGKIDGIVFCQRENCRPTASGISFLQQFLSPILKAKGLPSIVITPTHTRSHVITRLRAFMESTAFSGDLIDRTLNTPDHGNNHFMGIDVGSTTIKVVIFNSRLEVVSSIVRYKENLSIFGEIQETIEQALFAAKLKKEDIKYRVGCGSGSSKLKSVGLVDHLITEITGHAIGAYYRKRGPVVVLDIGGEDTKVIVVKEGGQVENFLMNTRCGAGTGRSLRRLSDMLHISLVDMNQMADLGNPIEGIGGSCSVHIESGVNGALAELGKDAGRNDYGSIIGAVFAAFSKNIRRLFPELESNTADIVMTGGGALLGSLVNALGVTFHRNIQVIESPQSTAAVGSAVVAKALFDKSLTSSGGN